MADLAWTLKRVFPFTADIVDLDGEEPDRGQVGFGTPPKWACEPGSAPPAKISRHTGWRPVIASLGYVTLNTETPADLRVTFVEQIISPRQVGGGTAVDIGTRWQQVVFDSGAVPTAFFYATNLPVPISEENGKPFQLRFVTEGRVDPSLVVIDWQWARFSLDISDSTQATLAGRTVEMLVRRLKRAWKELRDE